MERPFLSGHGRELLLLPHTMRFHQAAHRLCNGQERFVSKSEWNASQPCCAGFVRSININLCINPTANPDPACPVPGSPVCNFQDPVYK